MSVNSTQATPMPQPANHGWPIGTLTAVQASARHHRGAVDLMRAKELRNLGSRTSTHAVPAFIIYVSFLDPETHGLRTSGDFWFKSLATLGIGISEVFLRRSLAMLGGVQIVRSELNTLTA